MTTRNALTPYLERAYSTLARLRNEGGHDRAAIIRAIAEDLSSELLPVGWTEREVEEAAIACHETIDARALIRDMSAWSECEWTDDFHVEIVWSRKPKWATDQVTSDAVLVARPKLIPEMERDTYVGDGLVPWVRLTIHLPCWLVATRYERKRALHVAIVQFAHNKDDGGKLARIRPDISGMASTFGRFGADHSREAQAIAHANANPVTEYRVLESGQLVWGPTQEAHAHAAELRRQPQLAPEAGTEPTAKKGRKPKGKGGTQLKIVPEG